MTHNPAEALREALEPCPFCASKGRIEDVEGGQAVSFAPVFRVECSVCDCVLNVWHVEKDEAVKWWNARAALTSPAPAGGEADEPVQELHELPPPSPDVAGVVTGPLKDTVAMSADAEDNHVLRLHFNRPVTDADRAALINAHNVISTLSAEKGRLEAAARLRPMSDAPKNRTPVLLQVKASLPRDDLRRWEGLQFVGHHSGNWDDGFDPGWNMSAPVGHGGFPDEWFDGWRPLIARTALTPKEKA